MPAANATTTRTATICNHRELIALGCPADVARRMFNILAEGCGVSWPRAGGCVVAEVVRTEPVIKITLTDAP